MQYNQSDNEELNIHAQVKWWTTALWREEKLTKFRGISVNELVLTDRPELAS